MKKTLSLFLVFSLMIQPAFIVAQTAQPPKKGMVTRAKEKFFAMREAMKRGATILKANSQCLLFGKGRDCTPGKRGALRVIRDFTLGSFKKAGSGIKVVIQANFGCFVSLLSVVGIPVIATVGSVEAGIRALAASKEKMAKFKEVWNRWMQRMEKGVVHGGGLMPEIVEKHVEGPTAIPPELYVPTQCTLFLIGEILTIILIAGGIYNLTPAARKSSERRKLQAIVRGKVIRVLYDAMEKKLREFDATTSVGVANQALLIIFNTMKDGWPKSYKDFLGKSGLNDPGYADDELKIKTFDELNIKGLEDITKDGKSLISPLLLSDLPLFPFLYDKKRLAFIDKLKEQHVRPIGGEQARINGLSTGIEAIMDAQRLSRVPMSQEVMSRIASDAIKLKNLRRRLGD